MAALVMETVGTQEYQFEPEEFLGRIGKSYGPAVAADLGTHLGISAVVS
jgi:adenosine kinase